MIVSYKYKLKGKRIARRLSAYARSVNFVWNYCVDRQREIQQRWKGDKRVNWPSHYEFGTLTRGTSKELGINSQTVNETAKFFTISRDKNKRCPKKRKDRGSRRSLGWIPFGVLSRQITEESVSYWGHKYRFFGAKKRPLPSSAKSGAFVEDARGNWYATFRIEVKPDSVHGDRIIGIDLGIKSLVTTSDGEKYENPLFFHKLEEKIKTADKSRNKRRQRSLHNYVKNSRNDYLNKLSSKLVKECCSITIGKINSSRLAKSHMAKSIYDAGLCIFKGMLRYKASRHGVQFQEVGEYFTTQTCSRCGQRPEGRPRGIAGLGIREWVCSSCGASHDRDVNAAKNILALGRGAAPPAEGSP